MGQRGRGDNHGFGRLTNLIPVGTTTTATDTTTDTTTTTKKISPHKKTKVPKTKTRIIRISEGLYERLYNHSRNYYNVESYETIISDLLDCYEKNNKPE